MNRHRSYRRRRGIFIADALVGLAIVTALSLAMLSVITHDRRAAERIAATRAATDDAEQAMARLRAGTATPDKLGEGVAVEAIESTTAGGAPAGQSWVRVRVERNGRSVTLLGLVPWKGGAK
jgi:Tfp pilus assembly protein PilX